jgi:hypothetical protein
LNTRSLSKAYATQIFLKVNLGLFESLLCGAGCVFSSMGFFESRQNAPCRASLKIQSLLGEVTLKLDLNNQKRACFQVFFNQNR